MSSCVLNFRLGRDTMETIRIVQRYKVGEYVPVLHYNVRAPYNGFTGVLCVEYDKIIIRRLSLNSMIPERHIQNTRTRWEF